MNDHELLIAYKSKRDQCLERGETIQADFFEELCREIEELLSKSKSEQQTELSI